jgi:hypothetical protein
MSQPNNPTSVTATTTGTAVTNAVDPKEASRKVRKKLIIWTTFSVIIGSLPIMLNMMILFSNNKPIAFFDLFAHGELLLISVAIAADAVGDMIYGKKFERVRDVTCICVCFLIIIFAVSWFGSLGIGGRTANISGFGLISLGLFATTIFVSGMCKIRTEAHDVHA